MSATRAQSDANSPTRPTYLSMLLPNPLTGQTTAYHGNLLSHRAPCNCGISAVVLILRHLFQVLDMSNDTSLGISSHSQLRN